MKPTLQALALVKKLIEQGRAGERPFGVPLAVWRQEIAKQAALSETTAGADQQPTPDQYSILRGRRYNRTKKAAHGREGRTFSECQSDTPKDTATTLAEQHGGDRRSDDISRCQSGTLKTAGGRGNQYEVKCQSDTLPDTATTLAEQHGVHRATILRDGKRAEAKRHDVV